MHLRFYPRLAIALCSLVFSPFVGAVMLCLNLKAIRNTAGMVFMLVMGIIWLVVVERVYENPEWMPALMPPVVTNIAGSLLLTFIAWPTLLGTYKDYDKRNPWWVVLVVVLAILGQELLAHLLHPGMPARYFTE